MDEKSNNPIAVRSLETEDNIPGWTTREVTLLRQAELDGSKAISVSLGVQFFRLFLEGFSCLEIAKNNPGFTESDILICRKKYKWDEEKDQHIFDLNKRVMEKLAKSTLESLIFLTNTLTVHHKALEAQQAKYIQTGNEADLPKDWQLTPTGYKSILESIQKVTGQDRISTQKITTDTTVRVEDARDVSPALRPELQSKMLKYLADSSKKKESKGDADE